MRGTGDAAMLAASLPVGLGMLNPARETVLPYAFLLFSAAALLGTAAELLLPGEYDTVTVPTVIAAALLLPASL